VRQRDLDLRHLLEAVALHAEPLEHRVVPGALEGEARRHGDAAALAHRQLLIEPRRVAQRLEHALPNSGA
jgi:hypothetical protein